MSVLEVLKATEASLNTRQYVFTCWDLCACGHVAYAAGTSLRYGGGPVPLIPGSEPTRAYHEALLTLARANSIYSNAMLDLLAKPVRSHTYELARMVSSEVSGVNSRLKALRLVQKGIEWETKRLEKENRWKLSDTPETISPRTEVDAAIDRLLADTREASNRIISENQEDHELVAF